MSGSHSKASAPPKCRGCDEILTEGANVSECYTNDCFVRVHAVAECEEGAGTIISFEKDGFDEKIWICRGCARRKGFVAKCRRHYLAARQEGGEEEEESEVSEEEKKIEPAPQASRRGGGPGDGATSGPLLSGLAQAVGFVGSGISSVSRNSEGVGAAPARPAAARGGESSFPVQTSAGRSAVSVKFNNFSQVVNPAATLSARFRAAGRDPGVGEDFVDSDEQDAYETDFSDRKRRISHDLAHNITEFSSIPSYLRLDRVSTDMIAEAGIHGGFVSLVSRKQFRSSRNERECQRLAQALDYALADGMTDGHLCVEHLCRALAGVQGADCSGNWQLCDALDLGRSGASSLLLPQQFVGKYARQARALDSLVAGQAQAAGGQQRRTFGRGGSSGFSQNFSQPGRSFSQGFSAGRGQGGSSSGPRFGGAGRGGQSSFNFGSSAGGRAAGGQFAPAPGAPAGRD